MTTGADILAEVVKAYEGKTMGLYLDQMGDGDWELLTLELCKDKNIALLCWAIIERRGKE